MAGNGFGLVAERQNGTNFDLKVTVRRFATNPC